MMVNEETYRKKALFQFSDFLEFILEKNMLASLVLFDGIIPSSKTRSQWILWLIEWLYK